ncbi:MAG: hypothetical protein ABI775_05005 [Pseudonocardiales bacterium]
MNLAMSRDIVGTGKSDQAAEQGASTTLVPDTRPWPGWPSWNVYVVSARG